jgi:adenylate kinase family enzyme
MLMGVGGAGKTTVGDRVAAALGLPSQDGDALHPAENPSGCGPACRRRRALIFRDVA